MIERMTDLPPYALGFTASGQVTGEDYERVLIPAVEEVLAEHDSVHLLYHLGPSFVGFDGKAMWDDTRIGLAHFGAWRRVAVVTDKDWIAFAVRAMGFVMPGRVRVFGEEHLDEARDWISEPAGPALAFVIQEATGLLELEPHGPLEEADFERVNEAVDAYTEQHGPLQGILIRVDAFPGWRSFSGLVAHLRFVQKQQDVVQRVAIVSDGAVLSRLPSLANHFVGAELKHFAIRDEDAGRAWAEGRAAD